MTAAICILVFVIGFGIVKLIYMDHVNKYTKPAKTRRSTGARFEFNESDGSGKAVIISRDAKGCIVKIVNFNKDQETALSELDEGSDLLDKIEYITEKYGFDAIGTLPMAEIIGTRSFYIDYGVNQRYFVRYTQMLPDNIKEMLDELEMIVKPYFDMV